MFLLVFEEKDNSLTPKIKMGDTPGKGSELHVFAVDESGCSTILLNNI